MHLHQIDDALACASSLYAVFISATKFEDEPNNENQTMTPAAPYRAIVVSDQPLPKNSKIKASLTTVSPENLSDAQVRVRIEYSAINYKDVLAVQAHPGVAKKLPLVPGIDATGTVVESNDDQFNLGDQVLIAHAKFGTEANGGLAEYSQVPGDGYYTYPKKCPLNRQRSGARPVLPPLNRSTNCCNKTSPRISAQLLSQEPPAAWGFSP